MLPSNWERRQIPKRTFRVKKYTDSRAVRRVWAVVFIAVWVAIGFFVSRIPLADSAFTASDKVAMQIILWVVFSLVPTLVLWLVHRHFYYKKYYIFSDYLAAFKLLENRIIYDLCWVGNTPYLAEEFDERFDDFTSYLIDFSPAKYEIRLLRSFGKQNALAYIVLQIQALGSFMYLQQFVSHLPVVSLETDKVAELIEKEVDQIRNENFKAFQFNPSTQAAERMENTMRNKLEERITLLGYLISEVKIEPVRALAKAL